MTRISYRRLLPLVVAFLGQLAACAAVESEVALLENPNDASDARPVTTDTGTNDGESTGDGGADTGGDDAGTDATSDVGDDTDATAGDTAPDDGLDATTDAGPELYGGLPTITSVFPLVAVSDGIMYVEGTFLAAPPNDIRYTTAHVLPDGSADRIELSVITGIPNRLILGTPADYAARVPGRATLRITTPDGAVDWQWVYATDDTTFTGKTLVGTGLLGNVYALRADTPRLPDLDTACSQPDVVAPCPFTSLLAPKIDVPDREFDVGFPGLGTALVEWFAIRLVGYLDVPTAGNYGFRVCSDDGSRLWLAPGGTRTVVVDNDGQHSVRCESGNIELPAGLTALTLDYFQGPRNRIALTLEWTPPGGEQAIIPEENLDLFSEAWVR